MRVDRLTAVTVVYDDDVEASFTLPQLRANCPCAECRTWRDRGEVAWPRPGWAEELTIRDAELVGAWGISFTWSDGHTTGIYPWDALRSWWENP